MMGWMISNGLITCDLKDQLFTGALCIMKGVHVQDKELTILFLTGDIKQSYDCRR